MIRLLSTTLLAAAFLAACSSTTGDPTTSSPPGTAPAAPPKSSPFSGGPSKYWYQGAAELNTYDLQQIRYGELHPGTVSLIFVSEDFLTDEQVKNDAYANPNSTPVLKTNLLRRFTTGIYDYSVMSSVFTPTDLAAQPHTLKVTTSMQDWCGQSFAQLNYRGATDYELQLRSYFEREGDANERLRADFLEDELFNRIRAGGTELPEGEFRVLPSTAYLLMMHKPREAARAVCKVGGAAGAAFRGEDLRRYTIDFPDLPRRVEIFFEAADPHTIVGWTESYPSRGRELTTVATLREQTLAPYWEQNSLADSTRRRALGL